MSEEGEVKEKGKGRKLAFVVNNAAFFVSHRLPIAQEASRRGWSVLLLTGLARNDEVESIAMGVLARSRIAHARSRFYGSAANPVREILGAVALWWRLRRFSPDVVHCTSTVGLLYGGCAARLARVPSLVLAVSGLGYVFTEDGTASILRSLLRGIYMRLLRFACGHQNLRIIVQNRDDERWIVNQKLTVRERIRLIPGSGVELAAFARSSSEPKGNVVVLPARLLRDKGIGEFVEAVRLVRDKAQGWRFVLAGAIDQHNPSRISRESVSAWVAEGLVEWLGHVQDMTALLARTSIVCLPSYREGMPKALLEAAAAGCAVITTDVVGCRDAVLPGRTGDLVPARNARALADALLRLIRDGARREAYGLAARSLAYQRFGIDSVLRDTFELYDSL